MVNNILIAMILSVLMRPVDNHTPIVKITSPQQPAQYQPGNSLRYSINVSDKEDGESKFGEVAIGHALMEARFIVDTQHANLKKNDKGPLLAMMRSNCMNCHAFESKLIGPSFLEISNKYKGDDAISLLVKRIKDGSTGIWGTSMMPTHHELPEEQIGKMVQWILNFGEEKNVQYNIGIDGMIKLEQSVRDEKLTALMLTATYIDNDGEIGEDSMLLKIGE